MEEKSLFDSNPFLADAMKSDDLTKLENKSSAYFFEVLYKNKYDPTVEQMEIIRESVDIYNRILLDYNRTNNKSYPTLDWEMLVYPPDNVNALKIIFREFATAELANLETVKNTYDQHVERVLSGIVEDKLQHSEEELLTAVRMRFGKLSKVVEDVNKTSTRVPDEGVSKEQQVLRTQKNSIGGKSRRRKLIKKRKLTKKH